ncbi:MAG: dTDP-4-dehydrorhamnose 3,5-epimerase [Nitrospira sp.]|nr:dTDP-4-dehydrorhamnose 3,5-epimerase [Nitrospira sp.]
MIFHETKLKGAYLIDLDRISDERGFFSRRWCAKEFARHGLNPAVVQVNIGHNIKKGTVRGMHFQIDPNREVKLVYCSRGSLYDVIIDLREGSPTHGQWIGAELTAENARMLYVPEGFAHGYQTLEDETDLVYQTSQFYAKESASGVRFNDPAFDIVWPLPVSTVSSGDQGWSDYKKEARKAHG